jgi:hypothetical protein
VLDISAAADAAAALTLTTVVVVPFCSVLFPQQFVCKHITMSMKVAAAAKGRQMSYNDGKKERKSNKKKNRWIKIRSAIYKAGHFYYVGHKHRSLPRCSARLSYSRAASAGKEREKRSKINIF